MLPERPLLSAKRPRPRAGVSVSGQARHKYMATPAIAGAVVTAMDELEPKYRALIERISGYPMSEAARAAILAEVEAIYSRERAAKALPPDLPAKLAVPAVPDG